MAAGTEQDPADADAGPATVRTGGVEVEKSIRRTGDDVHRVALELASERTERVTVRLAEELPADLPLDRVGFHKEYGREQWSVEDGRRAVYEAELPPGETALTMYAIRPRDDADAPSATERPTVEVEPSDERATVDGDTETQMSDNTEETTDGSEGNGMRIDTVEDVMAEDDAEASAGQVDPTETDGADGATDDPASISLDDPDPEGAEDDASDGPTEADAEADAAEEPADDTLAGDDGEADDEAVTDEGTTDDRSESDDGEPTVSDDGDTGAEAESVGDDTDGVVAELAAELATGDVDDADLAVLAEHLDAGVDGTEEGATTGLEVRLQRTEREVNELAAYTDALETFLNENGEGQAVVAELRDRADGIDDRLASVSTTVDDLETRLEAVEARGERLDSLAERVDGLANTVETLETEQEETMSEVAENAEAVGDLSASLERLEDEHAETTDSLAADLDDVAADVRTVEQWHQRFARLLNDYAMFMPEGEGEDGAMGDAGAGDAEGGAPEGVEADGGTAEGDVSLSDPN
jgi:uncharacterized protein YoxC